MTKEIIFALSVTIYTPADQIPDNTYTYRFQSAECCIATRRALLAIASKSSALLGPNSAVIAFCTGPLE